MSFLVKDRWSFLVGELWTPLEVLPSAPEDLYIQLMSYYYNFNKLVPVVDILNDSELAEIEFKKIPAPVLEYTCITLLEGFYEVLKGFKKSDIADNYRVKLTEFIDNHNLRYMVTEDCKIHLSLQGLLASLLLRLRKSISGNQTHLDSLDELEKSLSKLMHPHEEKNCIRISSNLIEGMVVDRADNKANTLGAAVQHCGNLFPHDSLSEMLKNLYKFYSDYPNLRHAGNQAACRRPLKKDDALLMTALSLVFSSYVSNNDDGKKLLLGDF